MNDLLGRPFAAGTLAARWFDGTILVLATTFAALLVHRIVFLIWAKAAQRTATPTDDILLARLSGPARWAFVAIALVAIEPFLHLRGDSDLVWVRSVGLAAPAIAGWLFAALLGAANAIIQSRADIDVEDNLRARRKRTRASILYRIALFVTVLVTVCLMLVSLPSIRNVGVTLMASAGIAGLAVGAAAQPALKNLIAGIQMAFTEPVRIDDVVIVAGEWGRIEDIRLTYVVVKIWDERRLVVPVAKFLEDVFENWTRQTSQLLGTAFFHLDPTADVPRLRAQLEQIVRDDPLWDGRVCGLQVTDTTIDSIELRALISASNASKAFDLRCNVREKLLAFIAAEMPVALARRRGEIAAQPAAMSAG